MFKGYHPIVDITSKCMYLTSQIPSEEIVNQLKQEFPSAQMEWGKQFIVKVPLYHHPRVVLGVLYVMTIVAWIYFMKNLYAYLNSI